MLIHLFLILGWFKGVWFYVGSSIVNSSLIHLCLIIFWYFGFTDFWVLLWFIILVLFWSMYVCFYICWFICLTCFWFIVCFSIWVHVFGWFYFDSVIVDSILSFFRFIQSWPIYVWFYVQLLSVIIVWFVLFWF